MYYVDAVGPDGNILGSDNPFGDEKTALAFASILATETGVAAANVWNNPYHAGDPIASYTHADYEAAKQDKVWDAKKAELEQQFETRPHARGKTIPPDIMNTPRQEYQYEGVPGRHFERYTDDDWSTLHDRRKTWDMGILAAVSEGKLAPAEAYRQGLIGNYSADDWRPLPEHLYHVTTAKIAVIRDGLKSRQELGQNRGKGLGGGEDMSISFTDDLDTAMGIYRGMLEARKVARGEISISDMVNMAIQGTNAARPWITEFVRWGGTYRTTSPDWKDGDQLPVLWSLLAQGKRRISARLDGMPDRDGDTAGCVPDEGAYHWTGGDGVERYVSWICPLSADEQRDMLISEYKVWAATRENAGGILDPLFFGSDMAGLAQTQESDIALLEYKPAPGALGVKVGALSEWRTYSGDAVQFVREVQFTGVRPDARGASYHEVPVTATQKGRLPEGGTQLRVYRTIARIDDAGHAMAVFTPSSKEIYSELIGGSWDTIPPDTQVRERELEYEYATEQYPAFDAIYTNTRAMAFTEPFPSNEPDGPMTDGSLAGAMRLDLAGELDAITLYDAHLRHVDDPEIASALTEIRDDEKDHAAKFEAILSRIDANRTQVRPLIEDIGIGSESGAPWDIFPVPNDPWEYAKAHGWELVYRLVSNEIEAYDILDGMASGNVASGFKRSSEISGGHAAHTKNAAINAYKRRHPDAVTVYTSPYPTVAQIYNEQGAAFDPRWRNPQMLIAIMVEESGIVYRSTRAGQTQSCAYSAVFPDAEYVIDGRQAKAAYVLSPAQIDLLGDYITLFYHGYTQGGFKGAYKDRDANLMCSNLANSRNLRPVIQSLGRPFIETPYILPNGEGLMAGDRVLLADGQTAKVTSASLDNVKYDGSGDKFPDTFTVSGYNPLVLGDYKLSPTNITAEWIIRVLPKGYRVTPADVAAARSQGHQVIEQWVNNQRAFWADLMRKYDSDISRYKSEIAAEPDPVKQGYIQDRLDSTTHAYEGMKKRVEASDATLADLASSGDIPHARAMSVRPMTPEQGIEHTTGAEQGVSPGDTLTRVVWEDPGDTIELSRAYDIDVTDTPDTELYAVHVGDPFYWATRLYKDYDRDPSNLRVIDITVADGDRLIDDPNYNTDPDTGERAEAYVLLTNRPVLRRGVDFTIDEYETEGVRQNTMAEIDDESDTYDDSNVRGQYDDIDEDGLERIEIAERRVKRCEKEVSLADEGAFMGRYNPTWTRIALDNARDELNRIIAEERARSELRRSKRNARPSVGESREELARRIAQKARRPMPTITAIYQLEGSDGNWYRATGFPGGVRATGERRLSHYAYADKNGITYGTPGASEEELIQRYEDNARSQEDEFYRILIEGSDEDLQRQADYWLAKPAIPVSQPKPAPAPIIRVAKSLTGSAETDEWLKRYRDKKHSGRSLTATQESALALYESMAAADPSKWHPGMGVGWKVYRQTNRGYRILSVDPTTKTAQIYPVADTGLTQTGGGMEGIGRETVHIASLVRDRKYDAPGVRGQARAMVYYHGTNTPHDLSQSYPITESIISTTFGEFPVTRHGLFLSDNPAFAAQYGSTVTTIDIEAPMNTARIDDILTDEFIGSIDAFTERELWLAAKYAAHTWQLFDDELGTRFVSFLRSKGYDSAEFTDCVDTDDGELCATTLVILEPSILTHVHASKYDGPAVRDDMPEETDVRAASKDRPWLRRQEFFTPAFNQQLESLAHEWRWYQNNSVSAGTIGSILQSPHRDAFTQIADVPVYIVSGPGYKGYYAAVGTLDETNETIIAIQLEEPESQYVNSALHEFKHMLDLQQGKNIDSDPALESDQAAYKRLPQERRAEDFARRYVERYVRTNQLPQNARGQSEPLAERDDMPEELRAIAARVDELDAMARALDDAPAPWETPRPVQPTPGIVTDTAMSGSTTCKRVSLASGEVLTFCDGVIGPLTDTQQRTYCASFETVTLSGEQADRLERVRAAADAAKATMAGREGDAGYLSSYFAAMDNEYRRGVSRG